MTKFCQTDSGGFLQFEPNSPDTDITPAEATDLAYVNSLWRDLQLEFPWTRRIFAGTYAHYEMFHFSRLFLRCCEKSKHRAYPWTTYGMKGWVEWISRYYVGEGYFVLAAHSLGIRMHPTRDQRTFRLSIKTNNAFWDRNDRLISLRDEGLTPEELFSS